LQIQIQFIDYNLILDFLPICSTNPFHYSFSNKPKWREQSQSMMKFQWLQCTNIKIYLPFSF